MTYELTEDHELWLVGYEPVVSFDSDRWGFMLLWSDIVESDRDPADQNRTNCGPDLSQFWTIQSALGWYPTLLCSACGSDLANRSGPLKCHHSMCPVSAGSGRVCLQPVIVLPSCLTSSSSTLLISDFVISHLDTSCRCWETEKLWMVFWKCLLQKPVQETRSPSLTRWSMWTKRAGLQPPADWFWCETEEICRLVLVFSRLCAAEEASGWIKSSFALQTVHITASL